MFFLKIRLFKQKYSFYNASILYAGEGFSHKRARDNGGGENPSAADRIGAEHEQDLPGSSRDIHPHH